jgi:hypothetical protein
MNKQDRTENCLQLFAVSFLPKAYTDKKVTADQKIKKSQAKAELFQL